MDINAKRIAIWGTNTNTPLKPANMPSPIKLTSGPAGSAFTYRTLQPDKQILDKRLRVSRPGKYRLENKQQYGKKNDKAKYLMGKYLIYFIA
jgi:hypothetical protein